MAVYAAHLTRTLQGTPSVFDLVAQEALGSTIKPALRKVVEYLSDVYPKRVGWCQKWYDEIYLILDGCLQYHYLKHYAASFSEHFYGLTRVPIVSTNREFHSGVRLSPHLERVSLLVLILFPYLRDKVEKIIQDWKEEEDNGAKNKFRSACIRVYSIVHLSMSLSRVMTLCMKVSLDKGGGLPSLSLLGLSLRHAPQTEQQHSWEEFKKTVASGDFRSMLTFPAISTLLLTCIEYGAFFIQLIKFCAGEHISTNNDTSLPTPKRPERDERIERLTNKCPICLQPWKTPTVLPVSGLVFCYSCISRSLSREAVCPLTRLPAQHHQLIRLFVT